MALFGAGETGLSSPEPKKTPQEEVKETVDFQKDIEEPEQVDKVTFEPEVVLETDLNYQQAEAIESSFEELVDATPDVEPTIDSKVSTSETEDKSTTFVRGDSSEGIARAPGASADVVLTADQTAATINPGDVLVQKVVTEQVDPVETAFVETVDTAGDRIESEADDKTPDEEIETTQSQSDNVSKPSELRESGPPQPAKDQYVRSPDELQDTKETVDRQKYEHEILLPPTETNESDTPQKPSFEKIEMIGTINDGDSQISPYKILLTREQIAELSSSGEFTVQLTDGQIRSLSESFPGTNISREVKCRMSNSMRRIDGMTNHRFYLNSLSNSIIYLTLATTPG